MGNNRIQVPGQFGQDGIFRAGEVQILFTDKDPALFQIDPQLADLEFCIGGVRDA